MARESLTHRMAYFTEVWIKNLPIFSPERITWVPGNRICKESRHFEKNWVLEFWMQSHPFRSILCNIVEK